MPAGPELRRYHHRDENTESQPPPLPRRDRLCKRYNHISGPESSLHKMVIDPATGSISIRPRHLQTLRLLDFPTFLSLMFRAIDMSQRETSQAARQAATAVRTLLRDLTRCESLQWSSEPSAVWMFNAYLRWTHMVLTRRVLLVGFNCEHAFLSEAKNRVNNSNHQSRFSNLSPSPNPGPLIHYPSKNSTGNTTSKNYNQTNPPAPTQKSSHWFICMPMLRRPQRPFLTGMPHPSRWAEANPEIPARFHARKHRKSTHHSTSPLKPAAHGDIPLRKARQDLMTGQKSIMWSDFMTFW